jgi:tetratricopeptide (TPR) repeat protein
MEIFTDELQNLEKKIGSESAKAVREECLTSGRQAINDVGFWRRRVAYPGLAGDYFGLIQALKTYSEYEQSVEKTSKLLERYSDSKESEVQMLCAKAMVSKGVTLGEKLNKPEEEVATYNELLNRYGDSTEPEVQTLCATAIFNKGVTLREQLDKPEKAVTTCDELLNLYGDSKEPEMQMRCIKAMFSKALILAEKLDKPEEAVVTYDELLKRYNASTNPEIQAVCIRALENFLVIGQNTQTPLYPKRAIMVFLSWLEKPDTPLQTVLEAIHALPPDVRFTWIFDLLRRSLLPKLPEPRRTQAECFMDFFEQHRDVTQLEQCLHDACLRDGAQE